MAMATLMETTMEEQMGIRVLRVKLLRILLRITLYRELCNGLTENIGGTNVNEMHGK